MLATSSSNGILYFPENTNATDKNQTDTSLSIENIKILYFKVDSAM